MYYEYHPSTGSYNWLDLNYTLSGCTANNILLNNTASAIDLPFSAGALTGLTTSPSILISVLVNGENDYIQLSGGFISLSLSAELFINVI